MVSPALATEVESPSESRFFGSNEPEGYFCPNQIVSAGELARTKFWELAPSASLSFQWYLDDQPITNATEENYRVLEDDLGQKLKVEVSATSSSTPQLQDSVVVNGEEKYVKPCAVWPTEDGQVYVYANTSVDSFARLSGYEDSGAFVTYSWIRVRDGRVLSREPEIFLRVQDYGEQIQLKAIFERAGTWTVSNTYAPFTVSAGRLKVIELPQVVGSLTVGSTLRLAGGKYNVKSVRFSDVQWYRDGRKIAGANDDFYKLTSTDAGKSMYATMNLNAEGYSIRNSWVESTQPVYGGELVASKAPKVTGKRTWNSTLSATAGTWNVAPKSVSFQWLRDSKPIKKATKSTYKSSADDVGKKITVRVTAKRTGYDDGQSTSNQLAVTGTSLTAKTKPKVTGTFRSNQKLKVSNGTWNAKPSTFTYSWYRNDKKIKGATRNSYKVTSKDIGKKISAKVVAKRSGFKTGSVRTKKTAVSPALLKVSKKPKLTGSSKFGATLKVSNGTWSKKPTSYSYSWYRNGKKIKGATKKSYKLVAKDVGKKITAKVVAKRTGYDNGQHTTAAKKIAAASFKKIAKPKISGKDEYGKTLTAKPGKSTPKATSHSYQWYRDGSPIKGATKKKYKTKYADVYSELSVKVTSKRSGYKSSSRTSSSMWIWDAGDDDYDYDYDDGGGSGSGSGKAPNRCYLPGGQSFYYC